eukprot:23853_1
MSPTTLAQLRTLLFIDIFLHCTADRFHQAIRTTEDATNTHYGISILVCFQFDENRTQLISEDIPDTLTNTTQWLVTDEIIALDITSCIETHTPINMSFNAAITNQTSIDLSTTLFVCTHYAQQSLANAFENDLYSQLIDILSNETLIIAFTALHVNISTLVYTQTYQTSWIETPVPSNDTFFYYNRRNTKDQALTMALLFGISGGVLVGLCIFTLVTQIRRYRQVKTMKNRVNAVQPQLMSKANNLLGLGLTQSTLDLQIKIHDTKHSKTAAIANEMNSRLKPRDLIERAKTMR